MKIEELHIKHNKTVTATLSLLLLVFVGGLFTCIVLIAVNFNNFYRSIGLGTTIASIILLSVCIMTFSILFVNQIAKLKRNIIFIADEYGICDYSRHSFEADFLQ